MFNYTAFNGLATDAAYPFTNWGSTVSEACNTSVNGTLFLNQTKPFYGTGEPRASPVVYANVTRMKELVYNGVAVAVVDASSNAFMQYRSGIISTN